MPHGGHTHAVRADRDIHAQLCKNIGAGKQGERQQSPRRLGAAPQTPLPVFPRLPPLPRPPTSTPIAEPTATSRTSTAFPHAPAAAALAVGGSMATARADLAGAGRLVRDFAGAPLLGAAARPPPPCAVPSRCASPPLDNPCPPCLPGCRRQQWRACQAAGRLRPCSTARFSSSGGRSSAAPRRRRRSRSCPR